MTHNRKNGNVSWMNQQQINIQEKKMTSNNLSWHLFDGRKSMRMPIIIVRIIITTIIKTRKKNDKEMDFISGSAKFTRFIITRVVVEQAGWMACVGARARAHLFVMKCAPVGYLILVPLWAVKWTHISRVMPPCEITYPYISPAIMRVRFPRAGRVLHTYARVTHSE